MGFYVIIMITKKTTREPQDKESRNCHMFDIKIFI